MGSLILSGLRAIKSLFAPGMIGIFVISFAVALAALSCFIVFTSLFFTWLATHLNGQSVAAYLPWLGGLGSFFIAMFIFPGIMPVIISFFDDRIARIIEQYDYPYISQPNKPDFWPEMWHDMRFAGTAIFLNLLVLPLYLLPGLNLFLFYLLNGYLLGREFFVMAARRHMSVHDAEALRIRHGRIVLFTGILLSILATLPVINLFAPFWGVAVMVHLYNTLAKPTVSQ